MPTRYFRKVNPKLTLWMFGRPIQFHTVGNFGYIASDDPLIQDHPKGWDAVMAEIDRGMREGQGGVIEISPEQYEEEFVKKKSQINSFQGSKPHWREEVRMDITQDTLAQKLAPVVRPAEASKADEVDTLVNPSAPRRSLRERAIFRQ